MKRIDGRRSGQLRKISVRPNFTKHAHGSCLIAFGETQVICTAMAEEGVPPFLKGKGTGWVTAEYGMIPGSCPDRIKRNQSSGRVQEIQRLIGRSLRSVVDLSGLGEQTIKIDCDVIQADGGTRTASVTGGFIALALALKKLRKEKRITSIPLADYIAAVSVGIHEGEVILDLNYHEDSAAEVDMNVVMTGSGGLVEVQGTAEGKPFSKTQMDKMVALAQKGIRDLICLQKKYVKQI